MDLQPKHSHFWNLDANIWSYCLNIHRSHKADRLPGQRDLILALPRWRCPWNPSDLLSFVVTRLAWVSYRKKNIRGNTMAMCLYSYLIYLDLKSYAKDCYKAGRGGLCQGVYHKKSMMCWIRLNHHLIRKERSSRQRIWLGIDGTAMTKNLHH